MEVNEQRPSYVTFEVIGEEDRDASIKEGRYIEKNVEYAVITPVGSKDRTFRKVQDWFKNLEQQALEERIPALWVEQYKARYRAWKTGEDIPTDGTPIKGWPVLSPAVQSNVIRANIRTVEDLAQVNAEGLRAIGMGGQELKDKAVAWLKSANSHGKLAQEMASLQAKVRTLETQCENQQAVINKLREEKESLTAQLTNHAKVD